LFDPQIKAGKSPGDGGNFTACCEWCDAENEVTLRPEYCGDDGLPSVPHDAAGYMLDLTGLRVDGEHGPIPIHFGRRCFGLVKQGPKGEHVRCEYRWTSKECESCGHQNDIAARYCASCKAELVDPNEKLKGEFRALKRDPTRVQTDRVLSMECKPGVSQSGNKTLRVDFVTPWRSFSIWLMPEGTNTKAMRDWQMFASATNAGADMPDTVTYRKDADSGFYRVFAYNQKADEEPDGARHAAE